ncbi:tRNA dihydrouridine synthase DusB [Beggiatoa leptomitoformis]|uniref:tRNA-dihydrouridine synthase B n=1 Tax=Beggiatoa leptomitoformis TaxID=288004 RepID=A0A2N9YCL6_9GAMM|nr:tRNA dihydrouridine synthase DusB [Beggiatoa leptomitoformis]AUI68200.2 tRNA dihydrouridine synthase DusB [Beggiatoa leptomitoformis]
MKIGRFTLTNNLIVAPMAGVTDRPFRQLCKHLGAGMAVSEMVSVNPQLRHTVKTQRRTDHLGEVEPRCVQIAGADPQLMAEAAQINVDNGADIIDINMGCPAKKVCHIMAGSALLRDEKLVARILEAVVSAVNVPVTLKIRTGWDTHNRNGVQIAKIAENAGIQSLAVHGRTRACAYTGAVEYDTIATIKASINIPVIANGDIDSPEKARYVLEKTGVDGLMIGRAAQGRPWIFREIQHYLMTGEFLAPPTLEEVQRILTTHLNNLYEFYGEYSGVRIARKHLSWYLNKHHAETAAFRHALNSVTRAEEQLQGMQGFLRTQQEIMNL